MGHKAARSDKIGSANHSSNPPPKDPERVQRTKRARNLSIKQGRRLRDKQDLMVWYAASAYRPEEVRSRWQRALDVEHDRYELPDVYKDYKDEPTASQYGLVDTAVRNFVKSRRRLSSVINVGV